MKTITGSGIVEYLYSISSPAEGYNDPRVDSAVKNRSLGALVLAPTASRLIRFLDVVFSVFAIIVTFPIMLIVAAAVKLDSKGPVLFIQERLGQYRKPIRVVKFRTMYVDAEANGAMWAQVDDPRVTRLGRFLRRSRLDELPQFFNVLANDMSLVGPRPIRQIFAEQLASVEKKYDMRFLAKPGITGYAQIFSVYGSTVEDQMKKLEYDLMYLKGLAISDYFKLIFLTVKTVLGGGGV